MVLILNGEEQVECPSESSSIFRAYPVFIEIASKITSIPSREVGPEGLLYVYQREFAATLPQDKNVNILGSDDATSCIIIIFRHSGSGAIALAHLDGTEEMEKGISDMLHRIKELSLGSPDGRFELQLIGGYSQQPNIREDILCRILSSCHNHVLEINVTLLCVGEQNTTQRRRINFPIIYGVGVYTKTGEIFPATFSDKGPDKTMRQARCFFGSKEVFDVYDSNLGLLRIGPYYNVGDTSSSFIDDLLSESDEYILEFCSTTPEVEPPHFAKEAREAMIFIRDKTLLTIPEFKENRPRYYRRDDLGAWKQTVPR